MARTLCSAAVLRQHLLSPWQQNRVLRRRKRRVPTISASSFKGMNIAWNNYSSDFGVTAWPNASGQGVSLADYWSSSNTYISNGSRIYKDPGKVFYKAAFEAIKAAVDAAGNGDTAVARFWVFGDGRTGPTFSTALGQFDTVTGIDGAFMADFLECCNLAKDAGVKLIPTLWDFHALGIRTSSSGRTATQEGHVGLFLQHTGCVEAFINNALNELLDQVNTNGLADTILAIDIINEPEQILKGNLYPYNHSPVYNVDISDMQYFVAKCAIAIHAKKFKTTVGSAELCYNWENTASPSFPATWPAIFPHMAGATNLWGDQTLKAAGGDPAAFLDFYQIHFYRNPGNTNSLFDPSGPGNSASTYISSGKPIIAGEIGARQSSTSTGDQIIGNGFAGYLFWSYQDDGNSSTSMGTWSDVYIPNITNKFN